MDCRQARELMAPHLARDGTPKEWRALGHHLHSCPSCRTEAEALTQTWNGLAALPEAEVPAGVWERIQAQIPAPVPRPARPAPWVAPAATAVAALVVSIAASLVFPYEAAARLCNEGLRRLLPAAALPDPAAFFAVGLLYGLLPLAVAAVAAAPRLFRTGGHPGIRTALIFCVLALPYIILACVGLPGALTAALIGGILAGALAGGPAGFWAGRKFFRPAPAT